MPPVRIFSAVLVVCLASALAPAQPPRQEQKKSEQAKAEHSQQQSKQASQAKQQRKSAAEPKQLGQSKQPQQSKQLQQVKRAQPAQQAQQVPHCPHDSRMVVKQGEFSPSQGVIFQLQDFSAEMVSQSRRAPFCFQRTTNIEHGEVLVSSDSLTRVFQQKMPVLTGGKDSKIKDVKLQLKEDQVSITGTVKKLIWLPFTIEGPLSTDGTVLRVDAKTIKAAGIPVKGLLDMVGKQLASLMGAESMKGVVVQGDSISFIPEALAHVRGHILSAAATPQGLHVAFGVMQSKNQRAAQVKR